MSTFDRQSLFHLRVSERSVVITTNPEIGSWIKAAVAFMLVPLIAESFYVIPVFSTPGRHVNPVIVSLIAVGSLFGACLLVALGSRRNACTIDRNGLTIVESGLLTKERRTVVMGPLRIEASRLAAPRKPLRPRPTHYVRIAIAGLDGGWWSGGWTPDQAGELLAGLRNLDTVNIEPVRAALENPALVVPRDCLRCGYDLSRLLEPVCPECGPVPNPRRDRG